MDLNKQRLKSRLLLKFEPLKKQAGSLKRLPRPERLSKDFSQQRQKQSTLQQSGRNRSISNIRLPSLERKTIQSKLIDNSKSEQIVELKQMRHKIKTIKPLPTIKAESQEPINQTLTYLIKNQVLNIPKIVAMLQKARSDQFLYMKVKGIYQYEVCSQNEKGNQYITVSKNGMVSQGELIPLEKLIHEYQLYSRLKKIIFFKYFLIIKFMNKWNRGSKVAKFVETKYKIKKLLYLDNDSILAWKTELRNILFIGEQGGKIGSGWVNRVAQKIMENKELVSEKLLTFSMDLLEKFKLPLSANFELMNRVLQNLLNLNLTFETKLRIEKELEVIFKMGRMLQLHQLQSILFYLLNHMEKLTANFDQSHTNYIKTVLEPLQQLDLQNAHYISDKEKILHNATIKEGINFKLYIDEDDQIAITPSMDDIFNQLKKDINIFIDKIDKFDYKIIRVDKFNFITKNVVKTHDLQQDNSKREASLKQYIKGIDLFYDKRNLMKNSIMDVNLTVNRKFKQLSPFLNIYYKYRQRMELQIFKDQNFDFLSSQWSEVEANIKFCQSKIHDGEYFVMGYLSQLEIKEHLINSLQKYKDALMSIIPAKIRQQKHLFNQNVNKHLEIFRLVIKDPDVYITVHHAYEDLEDKILTYAADLNEIDKLQDLYLKVKKIQLGSLAQQKGLLNELKIKVKNFRETMENSHILYRRQVQTMRDHLLARIDSIAPSSQLYETNDNVLEIYKRCQSSHNELQQLNKELRHVNELQSFFSMKATVALQLSSLLNKFQVLEQIWYIYKEYELDIRRLETLTVMNVEPNALIKKYEVSIKKMEKYKKDPDHYKIGEYLLDRMPNLLSSLYLVEDLHNECLRDSDFKQIRQIFNKQYQVMVPVKELTLADIIQNNLSEARQQIFELILKSQKQQQIERLLLEFDHWWKNIRLDGQYLEEYPLIIIFGDNDHLRIQIEQYTTTLLNIINHKYGTIARRQCNRHLRNINALAQLLSLAINHQQKFLALFPILTSKYAEKQLPGQFKKFTSIIQKSMKNVRWLIKPTQSLNETTRAMLNSHIKLFDALSKYLSVFLEKKRVKFQRFYFLQDDELLEVLVGIGADKTIFRMFEGVKGWLIGEDDMKYGVEGVGGESLKLRGWSYKNQEPELIFKALEDAIRNNLNSIVRNILHSYEYELKDLDPLYENMPWMCVYTVELILFTKQIEINCFQNKVDFSLQASLIQQNIASHVSEPLKYSNYITLQLFLLHYIEELKRDEVSSIFDFKWYSFLRYYYEKDSVIMKAMGSEHAWGGEYQGLWNLMINTSDIRRAHISILSNIKYGNGVLLQGPSGTGKTESLKELGRCMAKYCVIFNCSSQVNIRTLNKLLSGLCYTGSWLCLDEINRLTAEIMSVVANQINTIKNAVVQQKQVFNFMGKDMKLRPGVAIFSTMNPIYLKRAKLTQNLKEYFRIISVNVPDYNKILEVMLYSSGIASSAQYSTKISKLFKNLSIQLMQRQQYDFGLRAMKFFIYNLTLIRKNIKNEEESIVDALFKTFYSRLDEQDKDVFLKVLYDTLGKNRVPKQNNFKVTMMKEAPQTGIIVMGSTSSKTTIIKQYIQLFQRQKLVVEVFNPNSLELKYFLGENTLGRWEQGIVERLARSSFQNANTDYILVLDSKLRSQTIQNFNTLLDDSKLLSLSNGTRLKIHNNFKIIMQTPDLHMTSPATITRCNVIHITDHDVDKQNLIDQQIPQMSNQQMRKKFVRIISFFSSATILRVTKLIDLILPERTAPENPLSQSEVIGYEKCLMYVLQISGMGQDERIREYFNRDNSVSAKKNPFHYCLNFSKYREGQFLELEPNVQTIKRLDQIFIPTQKYLFYQYVNREALKKRKHVLWKGSSNTGKTTSLLHSFEHIFTLKPQDKNILKLTIHPKTQSKQIIEFIEEKTLLKEQLDSDQKQILLYLDDINMANEEMKQFIRYTIEYEKIFSLKSKTVYPLPSYLFIADANNQVGKQFTSRFCRHFTEVNMPDEDQYSIRHIFNNLIKYEVSRTKTSHQFKAGYDLQLDKIITFFLQYMKINNQNCEKANMEGFIERQNLELITHCNFFKIINTINVLNDTNCKDFAQFLQYLISQLRIQQVEHCKSSKQLDFLKLAWNETFKAKFQEEYINVFKSMTGQPSDCLQYTKFSSVYVSKIQNWVEIKNKITNKLQQEYYISQFVLEQIIKILRILEWKGGHYCLVGAPGIGKKTILKISSSLGEKQIVDLPTDEKKIAEWYFTMIKAAFEKQKEQVVLIEIRQSANEKTLDYLQKMCSCYPVQSLLSSEYEDYAYNNAEQFQDVDYEKFRKPFAEVIEDFMHLARKNIQFLFHSHPAQLSQFSKHYRYLHKNTTYRWVNEFPSEAILQISNQMLDQSLPDIDKTRLNTVLLKIYTELIKLMKVNIENHHYHFKYNSFCHFNLIKKFIKNYQLVLELAKEYEDILNRSVLKVYEIQQTLEKLKQQIRQMEPKVKEKTDKLLSVVPILEEKKKASQEVKSLVLAEKREIEIKNSEIEQMVRQVELQIKKSAPLLDEANESMLTIKRGDLSQLRNNPNPHPLIKFTLENLVLLLGQNESLQNVKKILSDPNLLTKLKTINPTYTTVLKVQKRIDENPEWNFENVAKISYGIRYIVRWTNSTIKFNIMKHDLELEKDKVQQYKKELRGLEQQQNNKEKELSSKEYELKTIESEYASNKKELIRLQQLITINNKKYDNAQLIKRHLEDQMINWHSQLELQKSLRNNIIPTAIILTLQLNIYATLHLEEQQKIEEMIKQLFNKTLMTLDPNFKSLEYIKNNLIKEKQSVSYHHPLINLHNLTIQDSHNSKIIQTIYHFNNRPIFLDPDNQALNWLQRLLSADPDKGKMLIVKESFVSAAKNVEIALRDGHIVILLIEDELDQFTNDILHAKKIETSGTTLIEYNKNKFYLNQNFRLILSNKSRNPNLSTKVYISHPVLNFEVTKSILKNMIMKQLVLIENKDIYNIRQQLEIQTKKTLQIIMSIQDQIIEALINSKRNLIDNDQFINLLDQNQTRRKILKENEVEWGLKNMAIKKIYDSYENVSEGASKIFLSLKSMSRVNPLLTWNTELFLKYFEQAALASISTPLIEDDEESEQFDLGVSQRAAPGYEFDNYNIGLGNSRPTSALSYMSNLTGSQKGVPPADQRKDDFEEEHPTSIDAFENLIGLKEVYVDEKQKGTMSQQRQRKLMSSLLQYLKPAFTEQERVIWGLTLSLMEYDYKEIKTLIELKAKRKTLKQYLQAGELPDRLRNYLNKNQKTEDQLYRIYTELNPFKILGEYLTDVDILTLAKIIVPNSFSTVCQKLIKLKGYEEVQKYSQTTTVNWFQRSDNIHPILLVMGEDPIYRLSDYLSKKRYKNVILIPMGEGQNKLAEVVIEKEAKRENLVIIHNLHISMNFMSFLAKMLQQFQIRPPHKNFRLVLISTKFEGLNEEITNYCHKYLIEQPLDIKNQIKYLRLVNTVNFTHPYHKKLSFVLTYLHSVINNLSKYKPYGWNLKYQFHTADYLHALQTLKEIAQNSLNFQNYECNIDLSQEKAKIDVDEVDFRALRYMLGEVGYIGKLADDIDRVKMTLLISHFINPNIFKQNNQMQALRSINFSQLDSSNLEKMIEQMNEEDASIFGLHPTIRPLSQHEQTITSKLALAYLERQEHLVDNSNFFFKRIEPVEHKFAYINQQIDKYNEALQKIKLYGPQQHIISSVGNGLLLSTITSSSRIFNLKSFSNPREFFISVIQDVAHKNNVIYEKVEVLWSLVPKENSQGVYGISNLKLEGASLNSNNFVLQDGVQERGITLYLQAAVKKKEKQSKRLVSIPIYLQEERQGQINSYGDNTNLLFYAQLEASHPQQFWILRSTAFIVM